MLGYALQHAPEDPGGRGGAAHVGRGRRPAAAERVVALARVVVPRPLLPPPRALLPRLRLPGAGGAGGAARLGGALTQAGGAVAALRVEARPLEALPHGGGGLLVLDQLPLV